MKKLTIYIIAAIGLLLVLYYAKKRIYSGIAEKYESVKQQLRQTNSEILLGPAPKAEVSEVNLEKNFQQLIEEEDPKTKASFLSSLNPMRFIVGAAPKPQFKDKDNG